MSSHQVHRALNDALPAVAKIRVNLDLFPGPLPTPSPARCQAAMHRLWDALAYGSVGCPAACPAGAVLPRPAWRWRASKQDDGRGQGRRPGAKARGARTPDTPQTVWPCPINLGLPLASLIPGLGKTEGDCQQKAPGPRRRQGVLGSPTPLPSIPCQLPCASLTSCFCTRPVPRMQKVVKPTGRAGKHRTGALPRRPAQRWPGTLAGRLVIPEAVWFRHRCGSPKAWLVSLGRPVREGQ